MKKYYSSGLFIYLRKSFDDVDRIFYKINGFIMVTDILQIGGFVSILPMNNNTFRLIAVQYGLFKSPSKGMPKGIL